MVFQKFVPYAGVPQCIISIKIIVQPIVILVAHIGAKSNTVIHIPIEFCRRVLIKIFYIQVLRAVLSLALDGDLHNLNWQAQMREIVLVQFL